MALFDIFRALRGPAKPTPMFTRSWTPEGIAIQFARPLPEPSVQALYALANPNSPEDSFLVAYLGQLAIEERCALTNSGVGLPWQLVYELLTSVEHTGVLRWLGLPPERPLRPVLVSNDTLADSTFEVVVDGWALGDGELAVSTIHGAIAIAGSEQCLLPMASWVCLDAIRRFQSRDNQHREQHQNELGWGHIRALADAAGAFYRSPYLETTYVLTPETLRLPLQKEETPFGRVLTVEPTFAGAPANWLSAFDGFNSVQPHYDFTPRTGGHVRVVISEPVRKVLEVIKREMPARKVSGSRAERFVHNPWAFLGESARAVIKEEEFAEDRSGAGATAAYFSLSPLIEGSRLERVDLVVTEHFHGGAVRTRAAPLANPEALERFTVALQRALQDERLALPWNEFDLTIDGESTANLEKAQQLLHVWRHQPAVGISFDDVYELAGYSGRIEGIGTAKPVYVPVLQKPKGDEEDPGWLPQDPTLLVRITLDGHTGPVAIPLTVDWLKEFESKIAQAEAKKEPEVRDDALPTPLETSQARTLAQSFRAMLDAQEKVKPEGPGQGKKERTERQTLLVKTNFFGVDYEEKRRLTLALPGSARVELPGSLRPSIELKKHQENGIAWFQHLVSCCPVDCRGALLADDMGLGKTLQLLAVLAWYYENNPNAAPSIILAPKSLVWNWASEARKFFTDSFPEVLVLYDEELRKRKQPEQLIDERLRTRGISELLKPNWVGTAKVVITTYETLTNYEFSFAKQPFSFAICDEAQRIKTPGTQVSLAARALKADFRISCTGTPVENTLNDLWCLFDFVQPGLLGGLEEFARTYRRPIECETENQRQALERLQALIAPQTLRRTKEDIRSELPNKFFATRGLSEHELAFKESLGERDRLEIGMSNHQNVLYLGGLKKLQDAVNESDARRRARLSFGALHLMKAVCAEPYCLPGMKFLPDKAGRERHLQNSPKLAWLLERLEEVRAKEEKAIVFTELREVQLALFHFLKSEFGISPFTINGDSQHRQKYIDQFSASKGFDVIILSTLAAGAGLNVTAANHVFHFTRAWNPAKENQATDRAYRIGQGKDVYVYCPVLVSPEYDTFDVRLDELLRRKSTLAAATIDKSGMEAMLNGTGKDLTQKELLAGGKQVELQGRPLTMDDVDRMDGFRFEVFCKMLWARQSYVAHITPKRGGDGGIDVVALKGREGLLLQCKSSSASEIGWDAVKEVTAGAARYQAQFAGTLFRRVAVTNQTFTRGAREQAGHNQVMLVERAQLEEKLLQHPIDILDFESEVDASVPYLDAA